MRKKSTYIIYYVDKDGYSGGYDCLGFDSLREFIKWLHSEEIKATDISIYKAGKDFENNQDDVIEVYKHWWK